MITASWQPAALNTSVITTGPAPSWSTINDKALTCSGSEYQGDLGVISRPELCLAAAKNKVGVNYAVWQVNKNCYACSITGRGPPSSWTLGNAPGAVSFEGSNVVSQVSVSAQQATDRGTIVARVVNHGAATTAIMRLNGFKAAAASAVHLASDDLAAENTAANVSRVAPVVVPECCSVKNNLIEVMLAGQSYTVVTIKA